MRPKPPIDVMLSMGNKPEERAATAHAKLAVSAGKIERSAVRQSDSADRRTQLAGDRTMLATERTYAAWVRTGLAALAAGIGAKALLDTVVPAWLAYLAAVVLLVFAIFCFVAAVWREVVVRVPPPHHDTRALPAWLLIGFNGFLILVSVAAFAGVLTR